MTFREGWDWLLQVWEHHLEGNSSSSWVTAAVGRCQWDVYHSRGQGEWLQKAAAVSAQCTPSRMGTPLLVVLTGCGVRCKMFAWSRGGRNLEMCALIIGCAVTQPASDQHCLWFSQILSVWSHIICYIMFLTWFCRSNRIIEKKW